MDNLLILYAAPIFSLQLLIDGLLIGAIFALAAYVMALVWGVMKIINFTQGEFVILGGFIVYSLHKADLNPFLCVPLAAAALYIVGWVLYRIVIFRINARKGHHPPELQPEAQTCRHRLYPPRFFDFSRHDG
jgi:branched-chain amino acid transport system permease protein